MIRTLSLTLALAALFVFAGVLAADELTTTDGDTFMGTFEKLEAGEVHFNTESVGVVKVPVGKVESLSLDDEREVRLRIGDNVKQQNDVVIFSRDGDLYYRSGEGETALDIADVPGINETLPDTRPKWTASGLGTFAWTEGNTRTYTLGYDFDIKRRTSYNFMNLFARGSYFQDRELEEDPVRERKHHIGYLYQYIFDFRLTIDATQDFYFNEFAGYHYRSVTGFGPGYYIFLEDRLSWHFAAHLTYTYEDQLGGADNRGYWGARARTEIDWVSEDENFHVNYKGELQFDFDETRNVMGRQVLSVEYRFRKYFTAGLVIEHQWDNLPPEGFESHDFRFTFTLGFSWSGPGP